MENMKQTNYKREGNNAPIVMMCVQCFRDGLQWDERLAVYVYKSNSICEHHLIESLKLELDEKR